MSKNYIIKQTEENTWIIIDENGEIVDTITKDIILNYCKSGYEDNGADCLNAEEMIDHAWWVLNSNYAVVDYVDRYCQDWSKFTAWFDCVCVEYLAQEIVAIYKQRLLNFE